MENNTIKEKAKSIFRLMNDKVSANMNVEAMYFNELINVVQNNSFKTVRESNGINFKLKRPSYEKTSSKTQRL